VIVPGWVNLLTRFLNGALDAINKYKVKKAVDDPAYTISNGGELHKSGRTFADISQGAKRD